MMRRFGRLAALAALITVCGAGPARSQESPAIGYRNPTVTVSPSIKNGRAGMTLQYAMAVRNNDDIGFGSSTFTLNVNLPAGFLGSVIPNQVTVAPGQTGQAVLYITAPLNAAVTNHNFSGRADGPALGQYGLGVATYRVIAPPTAPGTPTLTFVRDTVKIAWTASYSAVTVRYTILRNGVSIASTPYLQHTDFNPPNGQVTYSIVAVDALGGSTAGGAAMITVPWKDPKYFEDGSN